MRRRDQTLRRAASERGAVLVMVAITMPVLIGFGGLLIDVGNWFAHDRHLQLQADAGALAGAQEFRFSPCDDDKILAEVQRYSSVGSATPSLNPQIGSTPASRLHSQINSETFYNQASPLDATVRTQAPCDAAMVDVKLTETDLPYFLKFLKVVPKINAHARVEINQQTTAAGTLPIGVPEIGPKRARALFVDESTGLTVASTDLERTGTSGGLSTWSNTAAPVAVPINTPSIGVRIILSGGTSTTCGAPLVDCYGAGTSPTAVAGAAGLAHIRGWSATPAGGSSTGTPPRARDVQLFGVTCEDGYFTATATRPCSVNVGAVVDFGNGSMNGFRVKAKRAAANNNTAVYLTPPAVSTGQWTGGAVPISATGATSIELLWESGCPPDRTRPCSGGGTADGSIGTVQRVFGGDEALTASGPIKMLRVLENNVAGANSFQRCAGAGCTHNLSVVIGLKPNLQNASSASEAPVSLKIAGGGSQNQALDCDPGRNLRDELANGCRPTYTVNTGAGCPHVTPEPFDCVPISTGAAVGQVTQGMDERILQSSGTCTAKNNFGDFPNLTAGDPRIVSVFLTPFGSFTGSGSATLPVTGFASFYVTGWDGGACQGQGDDPAGQGEIVGHYIKYIDTLNTGGGGEDPCDFDSLGTCVAVFTR